MPIVNLTTGVAGIPEIGKLRKGEAKPAPNKIGKDLTYFRFTTEDRAAMSAFHAHYGAEPREVRILVPSMTTEENFHAWKECWVASSLKHRCNGQTCVLWLKPDGQYSTDPIACPGGCKQVGRLKVVLPVLKRLAYVTVLTTSIWDIINIEQNLLAIQILRGDLRGIPMILQRREREISTPAVDAKGNRTGGRVRRKKSLITIEAAPDWVEKQLDAQQRAALPTFTAPLMLTEGVTAEHEEAEHSFKDDGRYDNLDAPFDEALEGESGADADLTQEDFWAHARRVGIHSSDAAPIAKQAALEKITWREAIAQLPQE